jgi:hypothetical protein
MGASNNGFSGSSISPIFTNGNKFLVKFAANLPK